MNNSITDTRTFLKWNYSQESHQRLAEKHAKGKSDECQIKALYHKMIYHEQLGGKIISNDSKKRIYDFVKKRHYDEKNKK